MSSTQPASTTELKEYALRKLGKPVIDINLADEQMNDMIDEAIQMFQEYHFDGTEEHYKVTPGKHTIVVRKNGSVVVKRTLLLGDGIAREIRVP